MTTTINSIIIFGRFLLMLVADPLRPYWDTIIRVSPQLYLDRREPFTPDLVGISVFESTAISSSFERMIHVDSSNNSMVIELPWQHHMKKCFDCCQT
jgi:hypothetical protein